MPEKQSIFTTLPEIKARQIAENTTAFAFLTKTPITPGHTLVSPKRVVDSFDELTNEEKLDIFSLAATIKAVLQKQYKAAGFNYGWNEGEDFGQSVPHFHLHIVPRALGDDGITEYEPRKFIYRPGSREDTPEHELAAIAKELTQALK